MIKEGLIQSKKLIHNKKAPVFPGALVRDIQQE